MEDTGAMVHRGGNFSFVSLLDLTGSNPSVQILYRLGPSKNYQALEGLDLRALPRPYKPYRALKGHMRPLTVAL